MPGLAAEGDLSEDQKKVLAKVRSQWDAAEKLHAQYRPKWEVYYGLSRNYRRLQSQHAAAPTSNDKDTVMDEFRRVFGSELFVPYVFTVIETVLPRIFSDHPEMGIKPLNAAATEACEPVQRLYERDQAAGNTGITVQEVARSGLRYGIGIQKTYWDEVYKKGTKRKPRVLGLGTKEVEGLVCVHQRPMAEAVDIFDARWDPAAKNMGNCSYFIHRTWRTMQYIEERVEEGRQRRSKEMEGGWAELDLEKIKGLASESARGEAWQERMMAAGMSEYDVRGNQLHEVWEYHDRDNVYTVLDRQLVVSETRNPFDHGDLPFQIYRPTLMEQEFVGIGEAEPIAHLQYELNTMRGQRRDAATLALERGYFYQVGTLDPAQIVTGAGVFNPVFGNPSEIIQPMPFTDIPQSGVSEEEALKNDIELASGMSESVVGTGGEETATGTQLVQAAANLRITLKSKNLTEETIRPAAAQRLELYRQHLTDPQHKQTVRVEDDRTPTGYFFVDVGPEHVSADLEAIPVGSSQPDDSTQKRTNAESLANALGPYMDELDKAQVLKYLLTEYGVENPEAWIVRQPKPEAIIHSVGEAMAAHGVDEAEIPQILQAALQHLESQPPPAEGEETQPAPPEGAPIPAGGQ